MRLKNLDLLVITAFVGMNVIWVLLPNHLPIIGIILALPLVFLLPGYTLTEVLAYKRPIDNTYRFIFWLGLSLAIDILTGLMLNVLPVGLGAISWIVSLGMLTVILSFLIAYLRRNSTDGVQLPKFHFATYEIILVVLAVIIAISSIQYSVMNTAQQSHPGFTQLWMLSSAQPDTNCAVHLGIKSFETNSVTYRVAMTINGIQAHAWLSVMLSPQEEWNRLVSITSSSTNSAYVEVKLYKLDKPEIVYRTVHMELNSSKGKITC